MRITRDGRGAKKKITPLRPLLFMLFRRSYDRGYPIEIGYLMSSNHEMVLDNKIAVVSSLSVD